MSNTHVDLSDGSMVACVVGRGYGLPKELGMHPQLALFDGLAKYPTGALPPLPANTKALLYTDGLAMDRMQALKHEAQRRGIVYVNRGNIDAVNEVLRLWLRTGVKGGHLNGHEPAADVASESPESAPEGGIEKKTIAPRGAISIELMKEADVRAPLAQEARRLFDIARQRGITTTYGSVEQALRNHKRKTGAGSVPDSLLPASERAKLTALKTLDDAIAGLQLLRDWVEQSEIEIGELKAFKAGIQGMLAGAGMARSA